MFVFCVLAFLHWYIFRMVFKDNGRSVCPCLALDVREALRPSLLSEVLTVGFSQMSFFRLRKFLFASSWLRIFFVFFLK